VRAEARRLAVVAASEKAMNYCAAAGVALGRVLHIEDANPQALRGLEGAHGASPVNDDGGAGAFDPSTIAVGASVFVAWEIRESA
jgi:uncharacterized protein YggE